ncbi:hypothetical protein HanIR_Chr04g0195921 [Helianthus annuus]|nr:hypothetical protein HanIR_Chr04g0195921 [Helianthus annuus]
MHLTSNVIVVYQKNVIGYETPASRSVRVIEFQFIFQTRKTYFLHLLLNSLLLH